MDSLGNTSGLGNPYAGGGLNQGGAGATTGAMPSGISPQMTTDALRASYNQLKDKFTRIIATAEQYNQPGMWDNARKAKSELDKIQKLIEARKKMREEISAGNLDEED